MKTGKNRLKGSVLFTVVSVMALLIIFLMSTLMLSTAASRRSHANYSQSQAEYTARAAIESFTQAMANNAAIAQEVASMATNAVIEPTVVINEQGMGQIGYYDDHDNWVENKIRVKCVGDTYVPTDSGDWEAQQMLQILVTARVGKEERTAAYYLRRSMPNEPNPLSIKGFQTVGKADISTTKSRFTGALCVGITDDVDSSVSFPQSYILGNEDIIAADISFINGNLGMAGNGAIEVNNSSVATIVNGDLDVSNPLVITVNYPYAKRDNTSSAWNYIEFDQKNIPYLYVNGVLKVGSTPINIKTGTDTLLEKRNGSPYNVFAGRIESGKGVGNWASTDLYLMDATGTSKIGNDGGSSKLYAWSSSVVNKTTSQFASKGGSIFCNHNLELVDQNGGDYYGDVRVKGNLTINKNDHIHGDLIVGGNLTINGASTNGDGKIVVPPGFVDGRIYAANYSAFETSTTNLFAKANIPNLNNIKQGYVKVQNKEASNIRIENELIKNTVVENVQWPNYLENGKHFQQVKNEKAEASKVQIACVNGVWTDPSGNTYPDLGWPSGVSWSKWEEGDGNYYNVTYVNTIAGQIYSTDMYIDYFSSDELPLQDRLTANMYSYAYENDDGDLVKADENATIYKAKYDGTMSNETQGDNNKKEFTMYKADVNGNAMDIELSDYNQYYTYYKNNITGNPIGDPTNGYKETDAAVYYLKKNYQGIKITDSSTDSGFVETNEPYTYYTQDSSGNVLEGESSDRSMYFKIDPATGNVCVDGDGNPTNELAASTFSYYKQNDDGSYTEVDESDAIDTNSYYAWYNGTTATTDPVFYYKEDPTSHASDATWLNNNKVANDQINNYVQNDKVNNVETWKTSHPEGVYPSAMTRENLNGTGSDGSTYKVVQTAQDIRTSVGYPFSSNVYYDEVPGGTDSFKTVTITGGREYNISSNTILKAGDMSVDGTTININPNGGTIWVVFDNFQTPKKDNTKFIVGENGTVNFFIKGTLTLNGVSIFSKTIWDQIKNGSSIVVREDDISNINYYGEQGSKFMLNNQAMACGVAKCPYTSFGFNTSYQGKNFVYVASDGTRTYYDSSHTPNGVVWVGNALFKEYLNLGGSNNFAILYTKSGGSQQTITNDITKVSWVGLYYDLY